MPSRSNARTRSSSVVTGRCQRGVPRATSHSVTNLASIATRPAASGVNLASTTGPPRATRLTCCVPRQIVSAASSTTAMVPSATNPTSRTPANGPSFRAREIAIPRDHAEQVAERGGVTAARVGLGQVDERLVALAAQGRAAPLLLEEGREARLGRDARLLGRHEPGRAEHRADVGEVRRGAARVRVGDLRSVELLGDAPVDHHRLAELADQDVARLEVAVDDPLRVGVRDRLGHRDHVVAAAPGAARARWPPRARRPACDPRPGASRRTACRRARCPPRRSGRSPGAAGAR